MAPSTQRQFVAANLRPSHGPRPRQGATRWQAGLAVLLLAFAGLACSAGNLLQRPEPTPLPTRTQAPTFTPTPDTVLGVVVITPASRTPGVIIVPPGVDPRTLIPLPTTPAPTREPTRVPETPTAPAVSIIPRVSPESPLASPTGASPTGASPTAGVRLPTVTPTPLPTYTPTATATPTETGTPTPTGTPTATATPYVVVSSGLVSLREGPGITYPLFAQLGPDTPVAVIGRNPEGTWYQLCCVNGETVWVASQHVDVVNDSSTAPLFLAEPPPTPTPTATATETPTITPTPTATPYPFQLVEGPVFFSTENELLTIWAKIFTREGDREYALPGYHLNVTFQEYGRPNTKGEQPSTDFFDYSVPPGTGSGNRVKFNYKFEYRPPDPREIDPLSTETRANLIGTGRWRIYVVDGAGNQISNAVEFDTSPSNKSREVYVSWQLQP